MNDYGVKALCAAIVTQTVIDWQKLCRKKVYLREKTKLEYGFDEIRDFLKSSYGAYVCSGAGLDSDYVLEKFEKELKDCMWCNTFNYKRVCHKYSKGLREEIYHF